MIVYANRKEVFRQHYGGGGLFHKGGGPIEDTQAVAVPAGTLDFLVNVTPVGKGAKTGKPSGNFPGGSTRTMEIHLSSPTQLDVNLR